MSRSLFCIVLAFVIAVNANAQTGQATLQGVVQDPVRAAVPEAIVTVTNLATGVVKRTPSNAEGRFLVPYLLPGDYSVAVEKIGFQRYEQKGIKLDVQQNLSIDVALAVGDVTTTVEVQALATSLAAATSTISTTIGNKSVTDLPLIGRAVINLAVLVPGVLPPQGNAGSNGLYGPVISGGRTASSDVRVDGISLMVTDANVGANDIGGFPPTPDAVQEFTVLVNTLAAEYGRSGGGAVLIATKSGGNVVHGSAYDFFRNNNLNADDFFSNRVGNKLAAFNSNQFGFSVGGPVFLPKVYDGRNRTFFFFDYQGTRSRSPSNFLGTLPLDAWRSGDFSNLKTAAGAPITIYDPLTVSTVPDAQGNYTRQPFAGNLIPGARIDPVSKNLMTFYPEPNTAPTNQFTQVNNFYKSQISPGRDDNFTLRIDHNFSSGWRSFYRLSHYLTVINPPNVFGNLGTPVGRGKQTTPRSSLAWDNTYVLNPTTVFNVTFGVASFASILYPPSRGFDLTTLGLPAYFQAQAASDIYTRFPVVSINGLTSLGQQGAAGLSFDPTSYNVATSVTKVLTRHSIKAGLEYRKFFLNDWGEQCPGGCFSYAPDWTQQNPVQNVPTQGFGLASLLLGLGGGSQANTLAQALASSYWGGYVQDDFHVSRKLTLNIGLRYEVDIPRTERYNRMSYWDPSAASPIAGQVPGLPNLLGSMNFVTRDHRRQTPTDTNNWSPRFGFAYQLGPKTVARGGYALMYAPSTTQAMYSNAGFLGFRCSTGMITSLDGRTPLNYLHNPFPNGFCSILGATPGPTSGPNTGLGQGIGESYFIDYRNPVIQQWNFNLQRELPGKLVVEAGYVASKGNHLIDGGNSSYNQLPAQDFSLRNSLNDQVANPFFGVITDPTSTLRLATVSRSQLLAPYPQYTSVNSVARPVGNSIYDSFQLRVERRFSNGIGFLVGYTGSKAITDSGWGNTITSINGATSRQNIYDRKSDRALDPDDIARRLVASFNVEMPFGRGRHFLGAIPAPVNFLLGGWQFNGIMTMQSGDPVTIYSAVNQTNLGSAAQRPNNNGHSANLTGQTKDQEIARWFDPSVFSVAPAFTFGNSPTVLPDVRNPGIRNFDLSLFKNFTILPENRLRAQFRLEAANALNTTQFGRPGSTVGNSSIGVISGVGVGARSVQLALKLLY